MSESSPSLGCSGSARLLLGQARARVEPDFVARARLDKVGIELELESSPKLELREKFPKIVRLRKKVTRS
jgi:hypothetical protein